jgi:hypothetical protein
VAYKIQEEICLNADRTAIVACDSAQAHFKLSPPNAELTDEEAVALGLLAEGETQELPAAAEPAEAEAEAEAEGEEEAEPEEKAVSAAPANKAVAASSNKKK